MRSGRETCMERNMCACVCVRGRARLCLRICVCVCFRTSTCTNVPDSTIVSRMSLRAHRRDQQHKISPNGDETVPVSSDTSYNRTSLSMSSMTASWQQMHDAVLCVLVPVHHFPSKVRIVRDVTELFAPTLKALERLGSEGVRRLGSTVIIPMYGWGRFKMAFCT